MGELAMKKTCWLAVFGVLSLTGCVMSSQLASSIEGRVTDHNGKPIMGAIVTTTPASSSVSSDADGKYTIRKLSSKEYKVHVTKTGYAEETVTVKVGGFDYPTRGDIQILPESMLVDETVVSEPIISTPVQEKKEKVTDTGAGKTEETKSKKKKWWEK
jgi:hypothetical protein